jgi:hypothetical protein
MPTSSTEAPGRVISEPVEMMKVVSTEKKVGILRLQDWTASPPSPSAQDDRLRHYSFPRSIFTTCRIAFSFRRYHRHCPCLVASTRPALVRIDM